MEPEIIRERTVKLSPGERIIVRTKVDAEAIKRRFVDKYGKAAIQRDYELNMRGVPFTDPQRTLVVDAADALDLDLIGGGFLFGLRLTAPNKAD